MEIPLSYGFVLAMTLVAGVFLAAVVILRRKLARRVVECPIPVNTREIAEHKFYTEYVMPLLVFERDYPSFIGILNLVISRFPISRFTGQEEVRSALAFLRQVGLNGPNGPEDPKQVGSVMCVVVNAFVNDPDVEYELRLKLPELLNRFLEEVTVQPGQPNGDPPAS